MDASILIAELLLHGINALAVLLLQCRHTLALGFHGCIHVLTNGDPIIFQRGQLCLEILHGLHAAMDASILIAELLLNGVNALTVLLFQEAYTLAVLIHGLHGCTGTLLQLSAIFHYSHQIGSQICQMGAIAELILKSLQLLTPLLFQLGHCLALRSHSCIHALLKPGPLRLYGHQVLVEILHCEHAGLEAGFLLADLLLKSIDTFTAAPYLLEERGCGGFEDLELL